MNYLFGPYTAVPPPPDIRLHSFPILRTSSLFTFLIHLPYSPSAFTFCIHFLHSSFTFTFCILHSRHLLFACFYLLSFIGHHLHATQSWYALFACFHLLSFIRHHLPSACHIVDMQSSRVFTCSVYLLLNLRWYGGLVAKIGKNATDPPSLRRISRIKKRISSGI